MTPTDRLQVRTVITGAALTLLTAFSLYVVYGPRLFSRWRWMRFSILMAVLTCLWTYAFAFFRSVAGDKNALNPLFFAMAESAFLGEFLDETFWPFELLAPGTRLAIALPRGDTVGQDRDCGYIRS